MARRVIDDYNDEDFSKKKNYKPSIEEDMDMDLNNSEENDGDRYEYTSDDDDVPLSLQVGVIGYSKKEFDETEARSALENILDDIEMEYVTNGLYSTITIVSGGTMLGIPKLAYEIATERGYSTVAIIPEQARSSELYDVDEIIWVGEKLGDESQQFIENIDVLVKIGGSDQSNHEAVLAHDLDIPIYEFDL